VATPSLDGTILRGITRDSVVTLIKDRGIKIEERKITLDEVRAGINSGEIVEVFACGTAAVITPIGQFKSRLETIGAEDAQPGELTASLREELTGIQYGKVADRHNWLVKLSD
jgi:branched-chain amino acid aminotransferase